MKNVRETDIKNYDSNCELSERKRKNVFQVVN